MINNDVIRSIRYTLNISETKLLDIITLGGGSVVPTELTSFLKREDEPGYVECNKKVMSQFLNGLIYFRRGKDLNRPPLKFEPLNNNLILKKLRVAFELKDDDILSILEKSEFKISKSELSALFRKEGHENYRACGDQVLRYFLAGLSFKLRPSL